MPTSRIVTTDTIFNVAELEAVGLSAEAIVGGINECYKMLDLIDAAFLGEGADRLAEIVELSALSSIIGEMFGTGIAKASNGAFVRNGPHKYPDLVEQRQGLKGIEIKVALEDNKPKGHNVKPGRYITCRYVLGRADGTYNPGDRENVVWIWEVRVGDLEVKHFGFSNTEGDSGKTAPLNAAGLASLSVVYANLDVCPFPPTSKHYKALHALFGGDTQSQLFTRG